MTAKMTKDLILESIADGVFTVDRDMKIIHEALASALEAGEERDVDDKSVFITEDTFFEYLKAELEKDL